MKIREASARCRRWVALVAASLLTVFVAEDAQAQSRRATTPITVTVGQPGDHWANMLKVTYIGRAKHDGKNGYKVTFSAADNCTTTLFWARDQIDLRGKATSFEMLRTRVRTGWLWFPSRLTAASLPHVHPWVLHIEADVVRQADAAIAGARGFGTVAIVGSFAPATVASAMIPRTARAPAPGRTRLRTSRPTQLKALPRSGPIPKSLGAMSRAEHVARKLKLNIDSPTTRQVLNSLDDTVSTFVGQFRKGSITRKLPREVLEMTVGQALQHSSKVRKLLIDGRFVK